jgi:hypothetical protein
MRRLMLSGMALLSLLALVATYSAAPGRASSIRPQTTPPKSYTWIVPKGVLFSAKKDSSPIYTEFLNGTVVGSNTVYQKVYEVTNPTSCVNSTNWPPDTGSNPHLFQTYHQFSGYGVTAANLKSGWPSPPPSIHAVLLDQESWCATSSHDKAHPYNYDQKMATAARDDKLRMTTAPALDLFTCPSSNSSCVIACPRKLPAHTTCSPCRPATTSVAQCYYKYDMAGLEAVHAKVIDIQAQSLDSSTTCTKGVTSSCWANFVKATIAQAKKSNPKVTVLVGIDNGRGTQVPTATTLERDLKTAIADGASGAWINENSGESTTLMEQVVQCFIGPQDPSSC